MKPDLSSILAQASGRPTPAPEPEKQHAAYLQPSRRHTKPITVHMSRECRDQLKIHAIEQGTTVQGLLSRLINHEFAAHGKPELADS